MLKLKFLNWWSNGESDFFRKFIESYIGMKTEIVNFNPDILFFSVFTKHCPKQYCKKNPGVKLKIFFTGEDTLSRYSRGNGSNHYYLDFADIVLGFKHLRFPLWLTYINIKPYNMGKPCLPFDKIENFKANQVNKFFCMISNHDCNKTRTKIVQELNKYKKVDIAGGIFKHSNIPVRRIGCGKGENNKQIVLNQHRFNICSESSINPGYITEKLFECLIGGCIPIYHCDKDTLIEPDVLNNKFIIKYNDENYSEVLAKIKKLNEDRNEFEKFILQKPLLYNAKEYILQNYYEKLKNKILSNLS
jgi:CRISPR/Cas system CSM-associated protein Csm2 small subunit